MSLISKGSMDGAETTKSGREFQVDGPATENKCFTKSFSSWNEEFTTSRRGSKTIEVTNDVQVSELWYKSRRCTLALIHAGLCTPLSRTCTAPSVAHQASSAYPAKVV